MSDCVHEATERRAGQSFEVLGVDRRQAMDLLCGLAARMRPRELYVLVLFFLGPILPSHLEYIPRFFCALLGPGRRALHYDLSAVAAMTEAAI